MIGEKLGRCYWSCVYGLCSVRVHAGVALYSVHGDVECYQFPLQSDSFSFDDLIVYITSIHSFFPSSVSSISPTYLSIPLFCILSLPLAVCVPPFFYLLIITATVGITQGHYGLMSTGPALNCLSSYRYPCCCY